MPNSNNGIFDPMAQYARLSERVENQGKDIVDLRSNMNTGFQSVNSSIGTISNELRSSIGTLSNELRSNSRTQWPVIWAAAGVCLAIIVAAGSQALSPIKDSLSETKTDIRETASSAMSVAAFTDFKNTYENNRVISRQESIDKFGDIKKDIDKIKDDQVPRKEHERVWVSYDAQLAADREARMAAIQNIQRQVDEIKQTQSGFFGQRDLNMQLLDRLERIERDKRQSIPPP
ncbi:hypothetical protein QFZ34_002036 [Phyllobacterium ifriqiyense]|uniref:DUF3618 domain-containing protein n=1 Tax=Phyllobacterium ifriqiyense TaxID=314238 RepID=A0ABU0S7X6_9HYPH|nr:hypothetical protein [Phyllobacterium ifriqiyense]MDQ0996854.1 hypothetical protein [Phyllobacterium ifriqiyense]